MDVEYRIVTGAGYRWTRRTHLWYLLRKWVPEQLVAFQFWEGRICFIEKKVLGVSVREGQSGEGFVISS